MTARFLAAATTQNATPQLPSEGRRGHHPKVSCVVVSSSIRGSSHIAVRSIDAAFRVSASGLRKTDVRTCHTGRRSDSLCQTPGLLQSLATFSNDRVSSPRSGGSGTGSLGRCPDADWEVRSRSSFHQHLHQSCRQHDRGQNCSGASTIQTCGVRSHTVDRSDLVSPKRCDRDRPCRDR